MSVITSITDRDVMKDVVFNVTVQFKRTWRGRFGFWLFQHTTKFCGWLMNCAIEVKQP